MQTRKTDIAQDGYLAVIPARGGSKRLPGKNTRLLGGEPLLVHSIKFALEAAYLVSRWNMKPATIAVRK